MKELTDEQIKDIVYDTIILPKGMMKKECELINSLLDKLGIEHKKIVPAPQ